MGEKPPISAEETAAAAATYGPPVDRLVTLGDPREQPAPFDYPALGLGPEQVPELIRLAADSVLNWSDSESREVWAPLHAWRALGQLQAAEAIEPLIGLFDELEDPDWFNEDMPEVFGQIGPVAIPALAAFLAEPAHELFARITASTSIEAIGKRHPEARAEAIAVLTRQLDHRQRNDPTLNGFLVSALIGLAATEAAPAIERAFAADSVDETIAGDWEDVQVSLRIKEPDPRKPHQLFSVGAISADELAARTMDLPRPFGDLDPVFGEPVDRADSEFSAPAHRPGELAKIQRSQAARKEKAKAKNKMAQQSRRKNRNKGKKRR